MNTRCLLAAWLLLVGAALAPAQDLERERLIETATTQLDQADALIEAGRFEAAADLLTRTRERVARVAPWLVVRSWMLAGKLHLRQQQWLQAEDAFLQVTTEFPNFPQVAEAYGAVAGARLARGRVKEARETLQTIIQLAPHSEQRFEAEQELVRIDLNEGQIAAAAARLDAFLKAFGWHPEAPALLYDLGLVLLDRGQPAEALARFQQLRTLYPKTRIAIEAAAPLVASARAAKQYDRALADLAAVLADRAELLVVTDATLLQADIQHEAGDTPGALATLDGLAQRYPDVFAAAQALLRKSELQAETGDPAAAIATIEAILKAFPEPFWQVMMLGRLVDLCATNERLDQAEDATRRLVQLTAGSPLAARALLTLAEIQYAAGRKRACRNTLNQVFQTYKGPPVVPEAQELLNTLDREGAG